MRRTLVICLLVAGAISFVQGTWIFAKAAVAQVLLRKAWAEVRQGEERARPWPWADTWPVARLLSPEHDVDLVVLEGASGATTAFGPGRIEGSALPGEAGNIALAAHRDTHFRFLKDASPGQTLWLELPSGELRRFEIEQARVVHQADTSALERAGHWLTLVTCYPFDAPLPGGPLRYVVQARPSEA